MLPSRDVLQFFELSHLPDGWLGRRLLKQLGNNSGHQALAAVGLGMKKICTILPGIHLSPVEAWKP